MPLAARKPSMKNLKNMQKSECEIGGYVLGLLDSVAKKATKELEKQAKDKGGKEIENQAKKEMKKRFKI